MKNKILVLSTIIVFAVTLSGCSKETWTGFYYPDITKMSNESTWEVKAGFKSVEDCRNWADDMAANNTKFFDYECGTQCRYDNTLKTYVCKYTRK